MTGRDVLADDADEHQEGSDESVEHELQRRPARAGTLAVQPQQEIGGDQHRLPEHVEEDQVGGHEHARQAPRHGEHQPDKAARARSHRSGRDRNHGQEGVQDDEPEADAVDAEAVEDAELRDPRQLLGELEPAVAGGEVKGDKSRH